MGTHNITSAYIQTRLIAEGELNVALPLSYVQSTCLTLQWTQIISSLSLPSLYDALPFGGKKRGFNFVYLIYGPRSSSSFATIPTVFFFPCAVYWLSQTDQKLWTHVISCKLREECRFNHFQFSALISLLAPKQAANAFANKTFARTE